MFRKERNGKAREVLHNIHSPQGRAGKKGGARKLLEEFKFQEYTLER